MGASLDNPHFIPLARSELIDLLAGDVQFGDEDRAQFRTLCEAVTVACHQEYHHRLLELKRAYAPFDPDADTASVLPVHAADRQHRLNELYRDFAWLLERARFRHLGRDEIEPVLDSASDWGIRMDVDFSVFEHLAIFARGDAIVTRTCRRLRNRWRPEEVEVPLYRRLVLILKLRPHPRLVGPVNTDSVFLKIFKDIPKLDVMMLLPGARVRLSRLDRSRIGLPLLSGVAIAAWQVIQNITDWIETALASPNTMWGIAAGGLGYGYRSFYGYHQMKQRYHLTLTQSLYFQNLDSNNGVVTRLLDEAEEQDSRLVILAWYCLWRYGGDEGLTDTDLDATVELFLDRYADVPFTCTPGAAAQHLRKLRMVGHGDGKTRALPLAGALEGVRSALLDRLPGAATAVRPD